MHQEVIVTIKTTQEKYLHELGDMYDAEQQFLKAQEEMLTQATDPTLKSGIQQHITESQQHVKNVEQVFQILGEKPKAEKCPAAAGIVTEGKQNAREAGTNEIRDCLIGGALDKAEHYEIVSYHGLITGAQAMGQQQVVQLLQQNLQQEEKTAQKLQQSAPMLLQKAMQAEGMQPSQQMGQTSARTM
jgi:ferritin-like metal-binding protein YciE